MQSCNNASLLASKFFPYVFIFTIIPRLNTLVTIHIHLFKAIMTKIKKGKKKGVNKGGSQQRDKILAYMNDHIRLGKENWDNSI